MKRFIFILLLFLSITDFNFCLQLPDTVRIGFLSNRSIDYCEKQWKPTVDFLQQKLPQYKFKFIPLTYTNIEEYVKNKNLEFVYTNPYFYIHFRAKYDITQLATIVYHRGIYKNSLFGTVMVTKAKNNIANIYDLKNKRIMGTSPYSYGGWIMALYEMHKKNFDPFKECSAVIFSNNHDSVMSALAKDKIDVGIVRTGILEEYQNAGKINIKDYRVINQDLDYQHKNNFNLLLSTKLYPEWLICKLKHTDEKITKDILEVILQIKETDSAAIKGDYSEFLSAADYLPVSKVLIELNMFPYPSYLEKSKDYSPSLFKSLQIIIFILVPLFIITVILFVYYQKKYYKVKEEKLYELEKNKTNIEELTRNKENFENLLNHSHFGVLIVNRDYKVEKINKKLYEILGTSTNNDYTGIDFKVLLNNWLDLANFSKEMREKIIRITHITQDRSTFLKINNKYVKISHYTLPKGGFIRIFEDRTEEKMYFDNMSQIESNYYLLTEGWTDLIWNIDLNLNITYISPNIEQITGYTVEEYLTKKLYEIVTPESFNNISALIQDAVSNPFSVIGRRVEFEHINKNGSKQWFETTLSYKEDKEKSTGYFAGVSRDITQKKIYENELKNSEEKFRLVFDQSPVCVLILDLNFNIKMANKAFYNFLNFSQDEIIGTSYLNLFAEQDTIHNKEDIIEFIKGNKENIINEFIFVTKSNKIVWGKVGGYAIKTGENDILYYAQIIEDVTELKRTESFLKESDLQFKKVWENSFDGMRLTDSEGTIILVNKSFCNLVKKSPEELIGKPFNVIYKSEDADIILQKGKERFKNHSIESTFERELTLWNNEKVWFELTNSYIYLDNKPKLLLSIFHDVTKRKLAEEEIKNYSKLLEEANASKDKFFSIIAHELKNPFQSSLGISELLVNEFDNLDKKESKELILSLNRSLKNQFNLLKNLLDWSRLQTGRITCNPDSIVLYELVNDVVYLLQNNINSKNINVEIDVDKLHIVFADYWMIRTVITNLVANAIKFTYNKGLIKIYSKSLTDRIELSVEDNGVGIEKIDIDKLFRIDCQISTLGTNNEAGTGLGLILCKEMIEKNNGVIGVESNKGLGSRFYFSLPKA